MGAYVNDSSLLANYQETIVSWAAHVGPWLIRVIRPNLPYETAEVV